MKKILGLSVFINLLLISTVVFMLYTRTSLFNRFVIIDTDDYESEMYIETTSKFAQTPLENADIVFLGDSLTGRGLFEEYFQDIVIANRGVGSDSTIGMYHRLNQVKELNPDKVFFMGGLNDLTDGYEIDKIMENIRLIAMQFEQSDTEIILQSLLPVKEELRNVSNVLIKELNEEINALANDLEVSFVNLYDSFLDDENQLADNYTIDGTHLTGEAYSQWVNIISGYIY